MSLGYVFFHSVDVIVFPCSSCVFGFFHWYFVAPNIQVLVHVSFQLTEVPFLCC